MAIAMIQESTFLVSVHYAAQASDTSEGAVRAAILRGQLTTRTTSTGRVLIERATLDRWLEWLGYRRGESDDPDYYPKKEALRLAEINDGILTNRLREGVLRGKKNPANRLLIEKASLHAWLEQLFPPPHKLDPAQNYRTAAEVAEVLGLDLVFVRSMIKRGQLKTVRASVGNLCLHMVAESDLQSWMRKHQQRFDFETPIQGDVLSVVEAAKRFKISPSLLRGAIREGKLRARKLPSKAGIQFQVGSQDVQDWREQPRTARSPWTPTRLGKALGVSAQLLQEAFCDGQLRSDIAAWLESYCPPYSPKVAGISPTLTLKQAERVTGLKAHQVILKAIRSGAVLAFRMDTPEGGRYVIPRFGLDKWLLAQGLGPAASEASSPRPEHPDGFIDLREAALRSQRPLSTVKGWVQRGKVTGYSQSRRLYLCPLSLQSHLDRMAQPQPTPDWLSVKEAAAAAGTTKHIITQALLAGELEGRQEPARKYLQWTVARASLESWAEQRRLTCYELAERFGIPARQIIAAVKWGRLEALRPQKTYLVRLCDAEAWWETLRQDQSLLSDPDWLSVEKMGEEYNLSSFKICRYIRQGKLVARRLHGPGKAAYVVSRQSLERQLRAKVGPAPDENP